MVTTTKLTLEVSDSDKGLLIASLDAYRKSMSSYLNCNLTPDQRVRLENHIETLQKLADRIADTIESADTIEL